ncbi:MAG: methylmalonyl-CoA epimerase [Elusimicrobia bacterium]|nr:methylmalonyl-CoA epimerase [Elusimicrobiota bacterium]
MKRLDHIAIAVRDLEESSRFYREVLGLAGAGEETVAEQKVKVAFFAAGDTRIELLQPTAPDSPVARFLESRGPGLHHICLQVDDLDAEMERLRRTGVVFTAEAPRPGSHGLRIAFLHPRSSGGALIELCERPAKFDRMAP